MINDSSLDPRITFYPIEILKFLKSDIGKEILWNVEKFNSFFFQFVIKLRENCDIRFINRGIILLENITRVCN